MKGSPPKCHIWYWSLVPVLKYVNSVEQFVAMLCLLVHVIPSHPSTKWPLIMHGFYSINNLVLYG